MVRPNIQMTSPDPIIYNSRRGNIIQSSNVLRNTIHSNEKKSKTTANRVLDQSIVLDTSNEDPIIQHEIRPIQEYSLKVKNKFSHKGREVCELQRRDQTIYDSLSRDPLSRYTSLNSNSSPSWSLSRNSETNMRTEGIPCRSGEASSCSDMGLRTPMEGKSVDVAVQSFVTLVNNYITTGRNHDALRVMERAVFHQEKRVNSGLQCYSSMVPLLTKLAQCQQTCGYPFEAKYTRDCVQNIIDDGVIAMEFGKRKNYIQISSSDPYSHIEGCEGRLSSISMLSSMSSNSTALLEAPLISLKKGSMKEKKSLPRRSHIGGQLSRQYTQVPGAGDASRGSIAASRNRNVYSYSFLEAKVREAVSVDERKLE